MVSESFVENKICFDSGASVTMTPDASLITDLQPYYNQVRVANGKPIDVKGRGRIGETEVLLVPDLRETLLSVSQFDKQGYYTLYGNNEVITFNGHPNDPTSQIIHKGRLHNNGLYYMSDPLQYMATQLLEVVQTQMIQA